MIKTDHKGVAHIVGLSGGKDSTALALRLKELHPSVPYNYVCSPTGDELPEMVDHWLRLGDILGSRLIPITASGASLNGLIREFNAVPNARMRWCTRILKIEPFKAFLLANAPCIHYVGIRADEDDREGIYGEIEGVTQLYPFQDWEWKIGDVLEYLRAHGISIPRRTDCARCYAQQLGEWWNLWADHPEKFQDGVEQEKKTGYTFRSESRDSWPASLELMRQRFEKGDAPGRSKSSRHQLRLFDDELQHEQGRCRVCTL